MSSTPVSQQQPASLTEERAKLAEHERDLAKAQRAHTADRAAILKHRAAGNLVAESECRQRMRVTAKLIAELTENIEIVRDTIEVLAERDSRTKAAADYREISKAVTGTRRAVERCEDKLLEFAQALLGARTSLDATEETMRSRGIQPDPYVLKAKLMGLIDIALYLETSGLLGRALTLDNAHQLRQSNKASLKRAAAEYYAITMRQVESRLSIEPEPPRAA